MKTDQNASAFPEIKTKTQNSFEAGAISNTYSVGGLTKREYFAATAMQFIRFPEFADSSKYEFVARESVKYADALIAELNK